MGYSIKMDDKERRLLTSLLNRALYDPWMDGMCDKELAENLHLKLALAEEDDDNELTTRPPQTAPYEAKKPPSTELLFYPSTADCKAYRSLIWPSILGFITAFGKLVYVLSISIYHLLQLLACFILGTIKKHGPNLIRYSAALIRTMFRNIRTLAGLLVDSCISLGRHITGIALVLFLAITKAGLTTMVLGKQMASSVKKAWEFREELIRA